MRPLSLPLISLPGPTELLGSPITPSALSPSLSLSLSVSHSRPFLWSQPPRSSFAPVSWLSSASVSLFPSCVSLLWFSPSSHGHLLPLPFDVISTPATFLTCQCLFGPWACLVCPAVLYLPVLQAFFLRYFPCPFDLIVLVSVYLVVSISSYLPSILLSAIDPSVRLISAATITTITNMAPKAMSASRQLERQQHSDLQCRLCSSLVDPVSY